MRDAADHDGGAGLLVLADARQVQREVRLDRVLVASHTVPGHWVAVRHHHHAAGHSCCSDSARTGRLSRSIKRPSTAVAEVNRRWVAAVATVMVMRRRRSIAIVVRLLMLLVSRTTVKKSLLVLLLSSRRLKICPPRH